MEVVLIDKFVVPEESKTAFLTEVRKSSAFLRTLPGFIEGFVYENVDGGSRHNIVTTAVCRYIYRTNFFTFGRTAVDLKTMGTG